MCKGNDGIAILSPLCLVSVTSLLNVLDRPAICSANVEV